MTNEKISAHIKSSAGLSEFQQYQKAVETSLYAMSFFIVHSPDPSSKGIQSTNELRFLLPREIARLSLDLVIPRGRNLHLYLLSECFGPTLENKFKHPIHHFQIQASNIQKSSIFYGELLSRLGFTKVFEMEGMVQWQKEGTRIIVARCPKRFLEHGYHRKRVGLNHIAFRAPSHTAVDELYRNYLVPKKIPTLYGGPKEWKDYDPGYYAVYFEDPDRIKLELVYVPGDL